ncbi:MAG TPA: hypothetical protein V6C89_03850 [Drouetiella sp.]|jgi:hypothetical protein
MSHHRSAELHRAQPAHPDEYIREADKDYSGHNENWAQNFIQDHYREGHGQGDEDNVRRTAAEAWARIKTDLRAGREISEDPNHADYWNRSAAAKDYLVLQKVKEAAGPESEFAGRVLSQIEKLQRNLHEDNEMQKLGFAKFDHILGATNDGRLDYQTKGRDGNYYSERRTAGGLGDVPTSITTGRSSYTEGTEINPGGIAAKFRTNDSLEKAPNGQPKRRHTEYEDENGMREINGRQITDIRSVDRQFNERTGGFDYKVRTKDGQDIIYSTDRNNKNESFAASVTSEAPMQGRLDQSMPVPSGGTELRNENRTGQETFEGTFNDSSFWRNTAFKRTDKSDPDGHLIQRTVEYNKGSELILKDKTGQSRELSDICKVETVFDPKTGRYEATYTDGHQNHSYATLSPDMKSIEEFHGPRRR